MRDRATSRPAAGDEPTPAGFEPSPRSRELLDILARRFEGDAAQLYEGGLRVFADESNPARLTLAASALREVMDDLESQAGFAHHVPDWKERIAALEAAWDAAGRSVAAGGAGEAAFVEALERFFTDFHEVPRRRELAEGAIGKFDPARREASPAVRDARAEAWMKLRFYFNNVVHRNFRPTESEFRHQVDAFEDFLFDWLRPPTFAHLDAIDAVLRRGPPDSDADRRRVAELIRRSTPNHEYFFEKVADPAWLTVLAKEKFFRKPLGPERGEGWIRFPFWPESRSLVRLAEHAPDDVFAIATRIGRTENVRVHEDLLRVAAQLPGKNAATLVRREARWLRQYSGHLMSLPDAAGDVLAHLAREQQLNAAYEFARAVLAVMPAEEPTATRRRAVARMNEYSYGRMLDRAWPALAEADPQRAFRFLCDRLADVIEIGYTEGDVGYDLTSTWRSAIEDHAQNLGHSLLDLLVDVARDRALELAQTAPGLALVLKDLRRRKQPLFARLAMHVISTNGTSAQVAQVLTDASLAYRTETWHEWGELLRDGFARLSDVEQQRVLDTIDAGPARELTPGHEARGITASDLAQSDRYTRLKRYAVIRGHLSGDAQDESQKLQDEFGEPDHPTFLSYMSSWTGPTSPFSGDDLRGMDPAAVAQALRTWTPDDGGESPSPEGLGRLLEEVVAGDAPAFATEARAFKALDATYVRAVLGGLKAAAKEGVAFAWSPVLELAEWLVVQPLSEEDESDDRERDTHWGWARKELASLLSRGFAEGAAELPFELRDPVWALLKALVEDPDPTLRRERLARADKLDPVTLSINTTRGEAMHAVVRYAFWVERTLGRGAGFNGEVSIPEVAAVLDERLNVDVEPSLAVRAVFGQWFAQLVRMDIGWATKLAPRVFPTEPEQAAFFNAAWDAYIVSNAPYTDVFAIVRDAYALAVERLDSDVDSSSLIGDPRKQLGDHLVMFRIRGDMDADDLFETFWQKAPVELRQEVLRSAGWRLEKSEELPSHIVERLVATWEWILREAGTSDAAVLESFGAWMGTRALDGRWLLEQALAALRRGIYLEPDFVVYRAAARLAPEEPSLVVEVLDLMVRNDPEDWSLHGSTDEVRDALEAALAGGDEATRRRARALIDILGARGMTMFRDLVLPPS